MSNETTSVCPSCGGDGQDGMAYVGAFSCGPCGGAGVVKKSLMTGTIKQNLMVELCFACGALPIDQGDSPWAQLPWIVHFNRAGYPRFLIDRRDHANRDMFSGYAINGLGSIGDGISRGSGQGGRLNFHRSFFVEELPA